VRAERLGMGRLIAVVADTRAASRDRNEALKWVVHLVGDIHQPLHAADNGDRGGNRVAVALEARSLDEAAGQGSTDSWALESNNLARKAYHYRGFACDSVPPDIVVLDQDYQRQAEAIVRERVLLAGARLAAVLNGILVSSESAGRRSW
jgi:hypothetical protein